MSSRGPNNPSHKVSVASGSPNRSAGSSSGSEARLNMAADALLYLRSAMNALPVQSRTAAVVRPSSSSRLQAGASNGHSSHNTNVSNSRRPASGILGASDTSHALGSNASSGIANGSRTNHPTRSNNIDVLICKQCGQ